MKTNYKKSLKFITLLILSVLIATVSAQIYSYMYIEGSGSITSQELGWQLGANAPSGAAVQGYTVTNLNFSIPKNTFKNFTDCLRLVNNDDTNGYTFNITTTVVGGNTSKFTTFDFIIYKSDWTQVAKFSVKNSEGATNLSIAASETLYIRFEVDPLLDAASGYMYFTLKLTYKRAS
jgi:hypothetical protein